MGLDPIYGQILTMQVWLSQALGAILSMRDIVPIICTLVTEKTHGCHTILLEVKGDSIPDLVLRRKP